MNTNFIKKYLNLFPRVVLVSALTLLVPTISYAIAQTTIDAEITDDIFIERIHNKPSKQSLLKRTASRIIERRHNKPRGLVDPNRPASMEFEPKMVKLPKSYRLPAGFTVIDHKLDLTSINSKSLGELSNRQFIQIVDFLRHSKVKIKWWNSEGELKSGGFRKRNGKGIDKSNAAAAIAMTLAMENNDKELVRFMTYAPAEVLPRFDGHVMALIDMPLAASIFTRMMMEIDSLGPREIAQAAGKFTELFIKYWAQKEVDRLGEVLIDICEKTYHHLQTNHVSSVEQKVGLMFGSLLAGGNLYADSIKEQDEHRLKIINAVSNVIWAATTYIGVIPMAAPLAAGLAATFSMAAVLSSILANELGFPRDFVPSIKELQGMIEMEALKKVTNGQPLNQLNTLMMLAWMRTALHVNGFHD